MSRDTYPMKRELGQRAFQTGALVPHTHKVSYHSHRDTTNSL